MISQSLPNVGAAGDLHTVWGMEPIHLHDRFWAARGVQVVRQGEPSEIVEGAEVFLLTGPRMLTMFKLKQLVEILSWLKPVLLYVRLHDNGDNGNRERAVTDESERFVRFERFYDDSNTLLTRVALTPHRAIAITWQSVRSPSEAWRLLRHSVARDQRAAASIAGRVYDHSNPHAAMQFMRCLVGAWKRPDATIAGVHKLGAETWGGADVDIDPQARFVGPVWVGAGRRVPADSPVVGPAVLWDLPEARPRIELLRWEDIEPSDVFARAIHPRRHTLAGREFKRIFDVIFSALILAVTLPVYPLIMLAIYMEDGRPFFFIHRRETVGGRLFPCIKFRSMRKNAEMIKSELIGENKADGPQFFLEDDPRLTRVGRFLRRTNVDEIPQFINVLLGDMSIVGPRPSPFEENQYCPAWREARLSVRPGVTGLWQVRRSRLEGMDFQEWIKYDIEYVENANWRLDLWVCLKTIPIMLRGFLRS